MTSKIFLKLLKPYFLFDFLLGGGYHIVKDEKFVEEINFYVAN